MIRATWVHRRRGARLRSRLLPPWLVGVGAVAALAGWQTSPARADIVDAPNLGEACNVPGFLTCRIVNGQQVYDFDISGLAAHGAGTIDYVAVTALKSSTLDPQVPANWITLGNTTFAAPSTGAFLQLAPRVVSGGLNSWAPGGMARLAVIRYAVVSPPGFTMPGSLGYIPAQLQNGINQLVSYPTDWKLAGQPLDPTPANPAFVPVGQSGKSVFVMSDDSVTPADNAKLGNYLTIKGQVANPITDTQQYYATRCLSLDANGIPTVTCAATDTISQTLSTLTKFRSRYAMAASDGATPAAGEYVARYFNRGDLGIGRSMHCKRGTRETACYVRNYSTSIGSAVQFGGSAASAFTNMNTDNAFATVAMVSRNFVIGGPDKVIFMVYDAAGNLANQAALDQHAVNKLGVAGQNYNTHIPGNCMTCHGAGGTYQNHSATGGMFLPFDLDQFDFDGTRTRSGQETAFRNLNVNIVRKVAAEYSTFDGVRGATITTTIDGWYPGGAGNFRSSYVPVDWTEESEFGDKHFYQRVLRPYCRGCHMTFGIDQPLSFERWWQYDGLKALATNFVCSNGDRTPIMPQAEQTSRQMWHSDARGVLIGYNTWSVIQTKECAPGPNR